MKKLCLFFMICLALYSCGKTPTQEMVKECVDYVDIKYNNCKNYLEIMKKAVDFANQNPGSTTSPYLIMTGEEKPVFPKVPNSSVSLSEIKNLVEKYKDYSKLDKILGSGVLLTTLENSIEQTLARPDLTFNDVQELYKTMYSAFQAHEKAYLEDKKSLSE